MPDSLRGADAAAAATTGGAPAQASTLPYGSKPLAALLSVFTRWGSGGFIQAVAESTAVPSANGETGSADGAVGAASLDATSIIAITTLAREGALRPSVLAEHLRVGASNVSKISARLGESGLLQKIADPADSRASLLQLTPSGEAVVATLVEAGDRMMDEILSDWPDDDRVELARLLQRFAHDSARFAGRLNER